MRMSDILGTAVGVALLAYGGPVAIICGISMLLYHVDKLLDPPKAPVITERPPMLDAPPQQEASNLAAPANSVKSSFSLASATASFKNAYSRFVPPKTPSP